MAMILPIITETLVPLGSILLAAVVLTVIHALLVTKLTRRKLMKFFSHLHVALRWLLILILFSSLAFITRPLRDLVMTPFNSPAGAQDPKGSMDELKWMLTILAGFAVITSIAQAGLAWLSALTYDKQAAAKLREIEANAQVSNNLAAAKLKEIEDKAQDSGKKATEKLLEIDKVLEKLRARYPLFYKMEDKRNQAHDALTAALRKIFAITDDAADPTEAINYMKAIYKELDVETRQLVLSVESFASIDLQPPSKGTEVANLKLFAVFYHAKYHYEKGLYKKELQETMSLGDLERAEGYLLLRERRREVTSHCKMNWGTSISPFTRGPKRSFPTAIPIIWKRQRTPSNAV